MTITDFSTSQAGTFTLRNSKGHSLVMSYENATTNSSIVLANGGTIATSTQVKGGRSVNIQFTGGELLVEGFVNNQTFARSYGSLTASGSFDFGENVKYIKVTAVGQVTITSISVTYNCDDSYVETALDGSLDDTKWTSEIVSHSVRVENNSNNYSDCYAYKAEDGIYVFCSQHVDTVTNAGNEWWQKNNVEFRIGSTGLFVDAFNTRQIWLSSLNGGSSNLTSFGVKGPIYNAKTGLYDINFEAKIPYDAPQLQASKDQEICLGIGQNINAGWASVGFRDPTSIDNQPVINENGLIAKNILIEKEGTEVLSSPVTNEGAGWNSRVAEVKLDGTKDWEIQVKLHSFEYLDLGTEWARAWVADILSAPEGGSEWSQGGWTVRSDWWDQTNSSSAGMNNIEAWNSGGKEYRIGEDDFDALIQVNFNEAASKFSVIGRYKSNVTNYTDGYVYIAYESPVFAYRGDVIAAFGRTDSGVTVNSIKVIPGIIK